MDLTTIFSAIITLLTAVFMGFVLPLIRSKMKDSTAKQLSFWVNIAVGAAEQLFESEAGEEKYSYVVDFITSKGFTFNEKEIKALIENSVFEFKNVLSDPTISIEQKKQTMSNNTEQ